jgi:HSP20 family molecular chaperone IbpA
MSPMSNPLLLGFEEIERLLDRITKTSGDGYPPYNIERLPASNEADERLRIVLAVAGFTREQLEVVLEDNQLIIRGKQENDKSRTYLYRGIAARQFQRSFVLASGLAVEAAELHDGLLSIDLIRPEPSRRIKHIEIKHCINSGEGGVEATKK